MGAVFPLMAYLQIQQYYCYYLDKKADYPLLLPLTSLVNVEIDDPSYPSIIHWEVGSGIGEGAGIP